MSGTNSFDPIYVPGRSEQETHRLQRQARLYEPFTRRFFETAGISTGMRVLDVGSGAGDVAFLTAKLVGSGGSVVGIDSNPSILETARLRASHAGLSNVTFVAGDIRDVIFNCAFDAVVGRHICIYLPDLPMALRVLARRLRPGGILAFQESDYSLTKSLVSNESTPRLLRQCLLWLLEGFRQAGMAFQMSQTFPLAFQQAGLPLPQMHLDILSGLGRNWEGYDLLAESLRIALPLLVRFGIVTEDEVDIDTFAQRLRTEVVSQSSFVIGPLIVGAWSYKTGEAQNPNGNSNPNNGS
jgi:ubiquinone/menaquinone biosynthesis C-methylase UbiE